MDIEQLPLQELFTRLRKGGLSIGIEEYRLLLEALRGGFGLPDRAALARLCCTLWVKSPQEKRIFDYHFEQVMGQSSTFSQQDTLVEDTESQKIFPKNKKSPKTWLYLTLGGIFLISLSTLFGDVTQRNPTEPPIDPLTGTSTEPETPTAPETLTDTPTQIAEIQVQTSSYYNYELLWAVLFVVVFIGVIFIFGRMNQKVAVSREKYLLQFDEFTEGGEIVAIPGKSAFLMHHEVFPITQRQMKQSWRYLRRLVPWGKPTELDIKATVNQISRQGTLLAPVLVPRRRNRTKILLLIDHDGSMVPFHPLSHRLVQTVQQGRFAQVRVYYFHNCPLEHLYHDPDHSQAERISKILAQLDRNSTVAMVFSDGGALRGGLNGQRIQLTLDFLAKLQPQVRYIAWLNPIPSERWRSTTAGEIARFVPMFGISRQGFHQAINCLRGKVSQR